MGFIPFKIRANPYFRQQSLPFPRNLKFPRTPNFASRPPVFQNSHLTEQYHGSLRNKVTSAGRDFRLKFGPPYTRSERHPGHVIKEGTCSRNPTWAWPVIGEQKAEIKFRTPQRPQGCGLIYTGPVNNDVHSVDPVSAVDSAMHPHRPPRINDVSSAVCSEVTHLAC